MLNYVLMLNWILWNSTVLTFNCVQTKTILILNWIVWIRTAWKRNIFDNQTMYLCKTELLEIELFIYIKMNLALNNLQRLIWHKAQTIK